MPRVITITKTLYKFDELSDDAKEKARDWFRPLESASLDLLDLNRDDFETVARILGVKFHVRTLTSVRTGKLWTEPTIYYTGFWSQGDGACYEGAYVYESDAPRNIREHAPKDSELHRIADSLEALQARNDFQLVATCSHSDHYYHAYSMSIDVSRADDDSENEPAPISIDDSRELVQLLRDFANWIYRQLENDYNWHMSDEAIDESITANEYEFDETGKRDISGNG
jgi:hypothetical protein